jgi:hypothetical protein
MENVEQADDDAPFTPMEIIDCELRALEHERRTRRLNGRWGMFMLGVEDWKFSLSREVEWWWRSRRRQASEYAWRWRRWWRERREKLE